MINYLLNNLYIIGIGLVVAFIASYTVVQKLDYQYGGEEVNRRSFFFIKTVFAIAPFLALVLVMAFLSW